MELDGFRQDLDRAVANHYDSPRVYLATMTEMGRRNLWSYLTNG